MSMNPEYCLHVLELAGSVSNPDLQAMCHKLEDIYFGEGGLFADSTFKPRRMMVAASSRVSIPIEHVELPKPEPEVEVNADFRSDPLSPDTPAIEIYPGGQEAEAGAGANVAAACSTVTPT